MTPIWAADPRHDEEGPRHAGGGLLDIALSRQNTVRATLTAFDLPAGVMGYIRRAVVGVLGTRQVAQATVTSRCEAGYRSARVG